MRGVFGFIGVANPELIVAEGLMIGTEQRQQSMQRALRVAAAVRAA
jgi:FMN-dependent NADH-azoreductase